MVEGNGYTPERQLGQLLVSMRPTPGHRSIEYERAREQQCVPHHRENRNGHGNDHQDIISELYSMHGNGD
ncbi:MAG: hypothetical protein HYW24_02965 [Candidatus Aenigmarchaeota archaeon]|nr:hypothetical protein [Candidatus Aenigmarchaeota archaeon]